MQVQNAISGQVNRGFGDPFRSETEGIAMRSMVMLEVLASEQRRVKLLPGALGEIQPENLVLVFDFK